MATENTPRLPQVYTCSMSREEADARQKAASHFETVKFEIVGQENGLVIGQTTVLDFASFKKFNKYPGVIPPHATTE